MQVLGSHAGFHSAVVGLRIYVSATNACPTSVENVSPIFSQLDTVYRLFILGTCSVYKLLHLDTISVSFSAGPGLGSVIALRGAVGDWAFCVRVRLVKKK